jgi:tripartite-type tricarboxylate transporter receptor subunit TctC
LIGRPLITPPSLPGDRLQILRDAFAKMIADPQFLAEAKKLEWEVEYVSGQELETIAKRAVVQTPETIARLKQILSE